jgi:hypothetical protein
MFLTLSLLTHISKKFYEILPSGNSDSQETLSPAEIEALESERRFIETMEIQHQEIRRGLEEIREELRYSPTYDGPYNGPLKV